MLFYFSLTKIDYITTIAYKAWSQNDIGGFRVVFKKINYNRCYDAREIEPVL